MLGAWPAAGGPAAGAAPATAPGRRRGPRTRRRPHCLVVGSSRAGRAWLPRARVLVPGAQVLAARAVSPGARAGAEAGLVEVQRTARRSGAAGAPVVLELVVLDGPGRRAVPASCTVPRRRDRARATGPPPAPPAHGVRRLVRAD